MAAHAAIVFRQEPALSGGRPSFAWPVPLQAFRQLCSRQ